jgi:hypothetical protein
MYKPFKVPFCFCLTTCCHFTFACQLYGRSGREAATGTSHCAPFGRNCATLALVAVVFGLQLAWLFVALPAALPLLAAFFPVVVLPAFLVLPLLITASNGAWPNRPGRLP